MQPANFSNKDGRPTRIVIVSHSAGCGGAERAAITLAAYWAECGATVHLYTGRDLAPGRWNYYSVPACVQRRTLAFDYEARGFKRLWEELKRYRRLSSAIRETDADVVIGSTTSMAIRVAIARLCERRRFLAVGWEHTNYLNVDGLGRRILRRILYRQLDRLVLLTKRDQERYRGISQSIVIENAPGVDGEATSKPRNHTQKVISVGRIVNEKGYDLLLDIAKKVNEVDQSVEFSIYGEGRERPKIEKMIAALHMGDVVKLFGRRKDISSAYQESDLFVLTSRFEGFPLAMLEAMSFGLPVVSFDCPTGPREILGGQEGTGLVPAGDTQGFADMILRILREKDLYDDLSRRNAERVQQYRLPGIARKWEAFLDISLSNDRPMSATPEDVRALPKVPAQ